MGIRLFEHNLKAYNAVKDMLEKENKACIVHPTGTGKSYIAFKLIEDNPDKKFVWLGPSEYIYQLQTGKIRKKQGIIFKNVEFYTYAWLMMNEDIISKMNPDYIILDEFHRAGAKQWNINVMKLIETYPNAKVFGTTATNIRYLDNHRDMAAEIFDGKVCSEFDIVEAMVRGIIPVPTYVVCSYYYKEKIKEYDERVSRIENRAVQKENKEILEKLKRALEQADGMDVIFDKHIKVKNGKYIVFCSNIEKMYEMMSMVPEWFGRIDKLPHIYNVHSYNLDSEDDFRLFQEDDSEHIKLLFTIDMLNEGIHIDEVDGVILLRPTISPIIYKQQIGRALSAGSEKTPVILDMVNNFDNLYSAMELKEEFKQMKLMLGNKGEYVTNEEFEIIDELRDSRGLIQNLIKNLESTWEMYYKALVLYKEQYGTVKIPKAYVTEEGLNLGKWLVRQRSMYREGALSEDKINYLQNLGVDFRRINEIDIEEWMMYLREYKEIYGNLYVSGDYVTESGKKLGVYVSNVRSRYKEGVLEENVIKRLEEIGFIWEVLPSLWEENYKRAEEYYRVNENLDIQRRYKTDDGYRLGAWIDTQRKVHQGKIPGILTDEQKEKLDAIDMKWTTKYSQDAFYEKYAAFEEYVQKYGSGMVPKTYVTENGFCLGAWVANLRSKYRKSMREELLIDGKKCPKSYITIEQEKLLNAAGMIWNVYDTVWDEMYKIAKDYYEKNGNLANIPDNIVNKNGQKLSEWVFAQKSAYRTNGKTNIETERVKKLESIGIDWRLVSDKSFEKGITELKKYKQQYGDILVNIGYVTEEGFGLGKWCARHRNLKRKGNLSEDRERWLEEVGFVWDVTEYYWNYMYEKAKEYYETYGDLKIPTNYVCDDGAKLSQWIYDMRRRYRKTDNKTRLLTVDQIDKLNKIGMDWLER